MRPTTAELATWSLRAAHVAVPPALARHARRVGGAAAASRRYDAATHALAAGARLLAAPGPRTRVLAQAALLAVCALRAVREPLATVAVAHAEEVLWRADAPRRGRSAAAAAVVGFALVHHRDGPAAMRYHLLTGGALELLARSLGLGPATLAHAAHNLGLERRAAGPGGDAVTAVLPASDWGAP